MYLMLKEVDHQPAVLLVAAHQADLAVDTAAPVDPALGRVAIAVPKDQAVAQVMDAMEIMEEGLITVQLRSLSQAQESDTELIMDTKITTTAQETMDMTPITAPTITIAITTIITTTTIKAWLLSQDQTEPITMDMVTSAHMAVQSMEDAELRMSAR